MIDKPAILALQQADAISRAGEQIACALGDARKAEDTRGALALPGDMQLHDLEKFLPQRRRVRGTMSTPHAASFAQYVAMHAEEGATVFVDPPKLSATAVLNLGVPQKPGHGDNTAVFAPPKTAAFQAVLAAVAGAMTQMKAAEFLEDWAACLVCRDAEGQEIKTPRAVAAIRRMTIEAMRKLESEHASLSASTSTFESVQAKSAEPLPHTIDYTCEPLPGLPQRTFAMRLGVQTGDKAPGILLRVAKMEAHQEAMAEDLAELVTAALKAAQAQCDLVMGTYQRGT